MTQILGIVFGYGELLAGIILCSSAWFIIRARDSDKMYAVIRNISVLLIALVILKVLSFNIL